MNNHRTYAHTQNAGSDLLVGIFRSQTAHLADVKWPCPECGEVGKPDSAINLALRWCSNCDGAYFVPRDAR